MHPLLRQLSGAELRTGLESGDPDDHDPLALVERPARPREDVAALPDDRPELDVLEAGLLAQLATQGVLERFAWVDAAARRGPELLAGLGIDEADEQDAVVGVEHQGARAHAPYDRHVRASVNAEPAASSTSPTTRCHEIGI